MTIVVPREGSARAAHAIGPWGGFWRLGRKASLAPETKVHQPFSLHQKEIEMINNRVLSIVFLVVGIILLFLAYQSSQSLGDQIKETITGRFTDSTTWFLILGAAFSVAGVGMMLFGKNSRR